MIIRSFKENTFLQVERADTKDYLGITVTVSLDGIAASTGTWFKDTKPFLRDLAAFERTRRATAELVSQEFTLRIEADGQTGGARLHFCLERFVSAYGVYSHRGYYSGTLTFEGEFTVEGEWIGQMFRDFTELLQE